MKDILIATHNKHKLNEFKMLLEPLGYHIVGADDINLPDIAETGTSFRENSALKAIAAAQLTHIPTLADDSGLCVHALNNAPGIYSARYAQEHGGYPAVFATLLNQLSDDFSAHFECCLCLAFPEKEPLFFEGQVQGILTPNADDSCGAFGYDPIFVPIGYNKPFGGLSPDIKNKISHRAKALEKLMTYLKQNP